MRFVRPLALAAVALAAPACRFDSSGLDGDGAVTPPPDGSDGPAADAPAPGGDAAPDAPPDPADAAGPDAPPATAESCADPIDLGWIGPGASLSVTDTTSGRADDDTPLGGCGGGESHPDLVYRVQAARAVRLSATIDPAGWEATVELRLRGTCDAPEAALCAENNDPMTVASTLAAGDVAHIWIDGGSQGGGMQDGSFTLQIAGAAP